MMSDHDVIIGYRNYSEMNVWRGMLEGTAFTIVETAQSLEGLINAVSSAVESGSPPHLVLVNPGIEGFAMEFIGELLRYEAYPIATVGYLASDGAGMGPLMLGAGAMSFIELNSVGGAQKVVAQLTGACRRAVEERDAGKHDKPITVQSGTPGTVIGGQI